MTDTTKEPAAPEPSPAQTAFAIELLRTQLLNAVSILTTELGKTDRKTEPTTYQTYRWLGAAMKSCETILGNLVGCADLPGVVVEFEGMMLVQIPVLLADAEQRLFEAMKVFKLDDLPPGNPGEPEFERLLKIEVKLNKVNAEAARQLATLAHTLSLPAYKLGITEAERATAWRGARRTKLEDLLGTLDTQLAEAREYLTALESAKAKAVVQLETNDQLTFDEVDPQKAPEIEP